MKKLSIIIFLSCLWQVSFAQNPHNNSKEPHLPKPLPLTEILKYFFFYFQFFNTFALGKIQSLQLR